MTYSNAPRRNPNDRASAGRVRPLAAGGTRRRFRLGDHRHLVATYVPGSGSRYERRAVGADYHARTIADDRAVPHTRAAALGDSPEYVHGLASEPAGPKTGLRRHHPRLRPTQHRVQPPPRARRRRDPVVSKEDTLNAYIAVFVLALAIATGSAVGEGEPKSRSDCAKVKDMTWDAATKTCIPIKR